MSPARNSLQGILPLSSRLCLIPGSLLAMLSGLSGQTNGQWTGATVGTAPAANYSNTDNWLNGIIADGSGATANFIYNPIADGGGAGPAGGFIFDGSHTLGNILLEDTAGYGSSTIGFNNPTGSVPNLTLASGGSAAPVIFGGQLLNSQSGGKKIVFNSGLAGTQGFVKTGPGYASFRGPAAQNTLTGPVTVDAGSLSFRQPFNDLSTVSARNGATLELDFGGAGVNTTNRLPAGTTVTLGGPNGGGSLINTAFVPSPAVLTTHAQTFAGVTLGGGANEVRAVIGGTAPSVQNMTWNLGTITPGTHATLNFARSATTGTGNFLLANSNGANGIVGPWLTFNSADWATASGGLAAAFAGYTDNTWASGNNTNITATASLDNATTGTLRFNTGNAVFLRLSGTNVIESGGIISNQQAPIITGGQLTTGNTAGDLFLHAGGGEATGMIIKSTIADNGATPLRLTKSLLGTVTLAANNTFSGGTTVGAGTLVLGTGFGGGVTGSVTGTVTLSALNTGTAVYTPNGALAFNRMGEHTITNAINPTVYSGGYIEQWAEPAANLIANRTMKVGGLRPYAGMVTLDFRADGAPAKDIIDGTFTIGGVSVPTARLTFRNGTLRMLAKSGGTSSQSFALTDVLGVCRAQVIAEGTLNLGALNRPVNSNDGGGVLLLGTHPGAVITTTEGTPGGLLNPQQNLPFVVFTGSNADWAARSLTSSAIVPASTIPGFYSPLSTAADGSNVDFDTNTTLASDTAFACLRFNTAGTLTTNGVLQPGGILINSVGGGKATIDGPGGLRAPTAGATGARDLIIYQADPTGKLVISTPIVNADAGNRTEITKSGGGELELTAANSYTGRTFVGEGILRLSGSATVGDATTRVGSLFVRGGRMVLEGNAAFFTNAYTSIGQRVGESGSLFIEGNATYDIAADFNIGDVNANGQLYIGDSATLNTRSFFIAKGGFSLGNVIQSGGSINAANTPAGEWNIGGNTAADPWTQGTYNLSGGAFNPRSQNFQIGRYGIGTMNMSGGTVTSIATENTANPNDPITAWHVLGRWPTGEGTLNLSGGKYDASIARPFFIVAEQGRGTVNVSGTGELKVRNLSIGHDGGTGAVNQTGGLVETIDQASPGANLTAGVVFGRAAAPGLRQPDYSGTYHLGGGVLQTYGFSENPVATIPITSTVQFDGGTLKATGDNPQFIQGLDTVVVQAGGAVIDSNSFALSINQDVAHDPALGAVTDGGLTKNGAGTLTLTGAGSWTGDTRVNGGTLALTQTGLADASAVRLASGGTMDLGFGGTDTIDKLFIDGEGMAAGTWGSPTSTATNKSPRFSGNGLLLVKTAGTGGLTGYDAWAALPANGLTPGVNDGKLQDPDNDGIPNLTEFVLDGNPTVSSTAILPAVSSNGILASVSFKRRDDSEGAVQLILQSSTDMVTWADTVIGATSAPPVTITENGGSPDDILVQVPLNSTPRVFARLKIISIP